jgi:tripartite ATP-independent transporter DctP family solute receptor
MIKKTKTGGGMANRRKFMGATLVAVAVMFAASAGAQEAKHYRFAHDQQLNTGYSVAYDMFSAKLKELSKGTMLVDQYPGAQLGQEPQLLQLVKSGDIDFAIVSSANTATISPQAGVMSLHFLFRSADHLVKSLADQKVIDAITAMIDETTQGLHVIATGSQGVRSIYSKKEIHNVGDTKGIKIRVQATATEDALFPAYGAQTVHMPFGSVYTSLQTGVVETAENSINVYLVNKHYEVAPVLSMTEHEANNSLIWISDKLWQSLSPEQRGWVQGAADEVNKTQPGRALDLERQSAEKLKSMGVKVVTDVDKSGFITLAQPYLEKLSKELGPHAAKIQQLISAVK